MKRDTNWFYDKKWGVTLGLLAQSINSAPVNPNNEPDTKYSYEKSTDWSECIAEFDTDLYAKQIADMGVGYVICTINQVTRFLAVPSVYYDKFSGYMPGEATSKIDIIEKLYNSLSKYNIDLLLCVSCDGPSCDAKARRGFSAITYGEENPHISMKFVKKWCKVIKELSLRYGTKIKGWWLDGCYYNIGYNNKKLALIANACRAGNPDAIVASNLYGLIDDNKSIIDHVRGGCPTDDFTFGEMWNFKDLPYGEYIGHCRWHMWSWFTGTPLRNEKLEDIPYTPEYMRDYISKVHSLGGVATVSLATYRDGKIDEEHLRLISKVKEAFS